VFQRRASQNAPAARPRKAIRRRRVSQEQGALGDEFWIILTILGVVKDRAIEQQRATNGRQPRREPVICKTARGEGKASRRDQCSGIAGTHELELLTQARATSRGPNLEVRDQDPVYPKPAHLQLVQDFSSDQVLWSYTMRLSPCCSEVAREQSSRITRRRGAWRVTRDPLSVRVRGSVGEQSLAVYLTSSQVG